MSLWNSLEFLHKINSILIISWVVISAGFGILSWKIQSKISELNINSERKLTTKVETTESNAKEFENKLLESERLRIETEKRLEQEIEKTNEKMKPPTLTLASSNVQEKDGELISILRFTPSKNQPFGTIQFIVKLPVESISQINDFWPTTGGGGFQSGPDSKLISEDRKSARLIYSLMGPGSPTVELRLTQPSVVQIQGNYISEPIEITVK